MVYYRRITPESNLDWIKELETRIANLETPASGSIVIREGTIITTDPETGAQTQFGTLPDGTRGVQPFIYDITPPPVATAPTVVAEPGVFVISWDGLFAGGEPAPRDFENCNIIGHKIEGGSTVLSVPVGMTRRPLDITFVQTDVAAVGETWEFSLEAEDYNGNRAAWSARSATVTMLAISDAVDHTYLEDDILLAQTTADGKNTIHYLNSAPAGTNHKQDDIWFDLSSDNKIYRWNATTLQWEESLLGNDAIFGNIDAAKMSVGFLSTSVLRAKSIGVDKLVITSTDNLVVEADFGNDGDAWQLSATKFISSASGRGGTDTLRFTNSTATQTSFNLENRIPVGTEDRFRAGFWAKPSTAMAANTIQLKLRCYTTASSFTDMMVATNSALVAGSWANISGISPILPENTIAIEIFLSVTNPTLAAITDIDYVGITRAADGKLIVDGDVTADKLEATMVLSSTIIAGDPDGTHAEMSPAGFKVYAADPIDGIPNEVVRLGVAETDDYFALTKADGTLAATISQDGVLSATDINANTALYYKGTELQTLLDRLPRGIVAAGYREHNAVFNAVSGGPAVGYMRLEVELDRDRIYRVHTNPVRAGVDAGTTLLMGVGYRFDAFADVTNQNTLNKVRFLTGETSNIVSELFAFSYTNPKRTVSFILWFAIDSGTGEGGLRATADSPVRLMVEDLGKPVGVINVGVHLDGAGTPPSPVNTYVKQYASTNSMNYQGNNTQYNWDLGHMYQGLSPAGVGNLKSISLHPDMTADLSGATVNYIRVYFNFNHWYYNSGGTAYLHAHGHTSIPGTYSSSGEVAISGGWPKPGARWVDLPSSVFAGFKSGAYRGIALQGDGTLNSYGIADRPTIEISYTK